MESASCIGQSAQPRESDKAISTFLKLLPFQYLPGKEESIKAGQCSSQTIF